MRNLVAMLSGGTAYAVVAEIFSRMARDYSPTGDERLAIFLMGMAFAGVYVFNLE